MIITLYNPNVNHRTVGPWEKVSVCESCYAYLSGDTIYYNDGLCPNCGFNSESTICDTIDVIYRKVYTCKPKWYELWLDEEYTIEAKDAASEIALIRMWQIK